MEEFGGFLVAVKVVRCPPIFEPVTELSKGKLAVIIGVVLVEHFSNCQRARFAVDVV